jgi:biopolymer transport protein ExbB
MARDPLTNLRGWRLFGFMAFTMAWMVALASGWSMAQDAAAPAAQKTAAAAPAVPVAAAPEDASNETESFLAWLHRASGIFGYTIFLCSFILIAVIMILIMQLRRDVMLPSGFVETFEEHLNSKDIQGAYETAKGDDSTIGRMMAAGMAKLQQGPEKAMEELQSVGEEEYMFIDHKLGYLALIAAVAPMLGLLGTVQGMIVSFEEIARSPTTPKPKDLAVGISMALVTTLEGLVVAIPAMVANSLLKNKAQVLMNQIAATATGLMGRFAVNNKAATAARPAGGAPPTAPSARAE